MFDHKGGAMKRTKRVLPLVMIMLCAGAVFGQEQKPAQDTGIGQWLKGLQQKISQIRPKREVPVSTGVAGVRGAKEDSQAKLYWKGKKGEEAVTENELKEFKEIAAGLEKDDKAGAAQKCEEFMKQFPDSALIPDVKRTLDLVKAEMKEPGK